MRVHKSFKQQARRLVKKQTTPGLKNHSLGSARNYSSKLAKIGYWCNSAYKINKLDDITPKMANEFLFEKAETLSQSTLDQYRQSLKHLTTRKKSKLYKFEFIRIKSKLHTVLKTRSYIPEQIELICRAQMPNNALATRICVAAGIRAHELLTIRPLSERKPDERNWNAHLFIGKKNWHRYTVIGKGGLVREIRLPTELASELEQGKLSNPITITDRDIRYSMYYINLGGGQSWSSSFSRASKRQLGWSNGAHGTRHTYVQKRMAELQHMGYSYKDARLITSQEIGHHRPDIINVYLR